MGDFYEKRGLEIEKMHKKQVINQLQLFCDGVRLSQRIGDIPVFRIYKYKNAVLSGCILMKFVI